MVDSIYVIILNKIELIYIFRHLKIIKTHELNYLVIVNRLFKVVIVVIIVNEIVLNTK
jgi:hypothetical protein